MKRKKLKEKVDFIFDLFTEHGNKEWFAHMRKMRVKEALDADKIIVIEDKIGFPIAALVWSVFKANSHTYIGRKGDFQIKQIVVSEKAKGTDRAKDIFRCAKGKAIKFGCPRMVLTVRDDNGRAQAFYKKMGMVKVKTTTVITKTTHREMRYAEYALELKHNRRGLL